MKIKKKRLGDLLVEAGELTPEQLKFALNAQKGTHKKLGEVLVEKRFMTERKILKTLEAQLGVPYVSLEKIEISQDVVKLVDVKLAERYTLIPIQKEGMRLTVAMNDPTNFYAVDDVRMMTNCDITVVIALKAEIEECIKRCYKLKDRLGLVTTDNEAGAATDSPTSIVDVENPDAPAIKVINGVIEQAVRDGATDIHIEPVTTGTRIRNRVDGVLRETAKFPLRIHNQLVSRVKIMAGMDIAEKRLPQDGRMALMRDGREIDIRVSSLPLIGGEKLVLRLLNKNQTLVDLKNMEFTPKNLQLFKSLYSASHGIVLVTGPTGSGKSTTLYATLQEIDSPDKNIITVEDPVEYHMEGIGQVSINTKAGLTFAKSLRSILRQDPDVIMVGEIRDLETAQIAIHAALTGHLVFSTLHTNDAAGAISRLLDMGIEPYLVVSCLRGAVAQRLVRRICPDCREEYIPAPVSRERAYMGLAADAQVTLYRGRGCAKCNHTGYRGRVAIQEVLPCTEDMHDLILQHASDSRLFQTARKEGVRSMKEDGIDKALRGITTIDELLRVAYA